MHDIQYIETHYVTAGRYVKQMHMRIKRVQLECISAIKRKVVIAVVSIVVIQYMEYFYVVGQIKWATHFNSL